VNIRVRFWIGSSHSPAELLKGIPRDELTGKFMLRLTYLFIPELTASEKFVKSQLLFRMSMVVFNPEDGISVIGWLVGTHLLMHTVLQLKTTAVNISPPLENEISFSRCPVPNKVYIEILSVFFGAKHTYGRK
jgi:hypothetical protein